MGAIVNFVRQWRKMGVFSEESLRLLNPFSGTFLHDLQEANARMNHAGPKAVLTLLGCRAILAIMTKVAQDAQKEQNKVKSNSG